MDDFLSRQRLLVISPHADDETLFSGGLMSKIKSLGGEVFVICFSVGNLDHFDDKDGHIVERNVRQYELGKAMEVLGVDDHEILFISDEKHLRMDAIPRRDLVNLLEREARLATEKIRPTMMVLPAPSFNQDHEAIYHAGITCTRPHLATLKSFQNVVLIADMPQLAWGRVGFQPNVYVDISGEHLKRKLDAYRCHKSQVRPDPHQGSVETVELLAKMRGREVSLEAAEAYEALRFLM
ncbi:MAG: PIG-L family deacetylase [Planctomycetes bacterium]|nr:PIG-L family deacetylase [Planctomycetota bacterium]